MDRGREGGIEGGRKGGKKAVREEGREVWRDRWREGESEGWREGGAKFLIVFHSQDNITRSLNLMENNILAGKKGKKYNTTYFYSQKIRKRKETYYNY